jgi:co-chaperonin GroES (HSP10)
MPAMSMFHEVDPREVLLEKIGSVADFELFNNQVMIALYIRPTKTKSGIYITEKTVDEDIYQSKVGLVVKLGPTAFQDAEGEWFKNVTIQEGDWLVSRPSDGWTITINNVPCRILHDVNVRGRIQDVDQVW